MHCFSVDYVFWKGIHLHLFPVEFRSMIGSSCAAVQGEAGEFEIKLGSHLPGYYKSCGLHWVPKMAQNAREKLPSGFAGWPASKGSVLIGAQPLKSAVGSHPAGTWRLAAGTDRNFPSLTCVMQGWMECTASCHPGSGTVERIKLHLGSLAL